VRTFTLDMLEKISDRPSPQHLRTYLSRRKVSQGFEIKAGQVRFSTRGFEHENSPMWMMKAFDVVHEARASLSPHLSSRIRNETRKISPKFRASRHATRIFRDILMSKGAGYVLRQMNETGFLARFVPEFGRFRFRVCRRSNRQCSVAEHCLSAVEELDKLIEDGVSTRGSAIDQRSITGDEVLCLVLALLIKDFRGNKEAASRRLLPKRVASRLGLGAEAAETLTFLLENGPVMVRLAETRDYLEDGVLARFAGLVGNIHRLDILFLFVLADARAEPRHESAWRTSLLAGLYEHTKAVFNRLRPARLPDQPNGRPNNGQVEMMPAAYLPATRILPSASVEESLEEGQVIIRWRPREEGGYHEVTVFTRDFPGLFARLAGMFTALEWDILAADLFTRQDGTVSDLFCIRPRRQVGMASDQARRRIERGLREAVKPEFDIEQMMNRWQTAHRRSITWRQVNAEIRPSVIVDSATSSRSTIVEVRAEDRPGLAYLIARTLVQLQIDIRLARIATEKHYALDVFYVRGPQGAKLSSYEVETAQLHLLAALERTED
jgi:[protein-PII] uridylyltransferase